jgi:hypothetical protein
MGSTLCFMLQHTTTKQQVNDSRPRCLMHVICRPRRQLLLQYPRCRKQARLPAAAWLQQCSRPTVTLARARQMEKAPSRHELGVGHVAAAVGLRGRRCARGACVCVRWCVLLHVCAAVDVFGFGC